MTGYCLHISHSGLTIIPGSWFHFQVKELILDGWPKGIRVELKSDNLQISAVCQSKEQTYTWNSPPTMPADSLQPSSRTRSYSLANRDD